MDGDTVKAEDSVTARFDNWHLLFSCYRHTGTQWICFLTEYL